MSTRDAVSVTRQAKLSTSVKAARATSSRSRKLRSDKHTHVYREYVFVNMYLILEYVFDT